MFNVNKLNTLKTAAKNVCQITQVYKSQNVYFHLQKFSRCFSTKSSANTQEAVEKEKAGNQMKLLDIPLENTRNFSIIAHVDHGKSTLADRLLEITGAVTLEPGKQQVLDSLQVERERGITVKAQTVSIQYTLSGKQYLLNLIDTPGHVDFANEVSRSLAACQGVLLLVDANQGVQAQTVANFYLAFTSDLVIIPVLNKIDLKNANPDAVALQLQNLFDFDPEDVIKISAKLGTGIDSLLEAIINRVPPPPADRSVPLRALIFDSWFDKFRGAVALIYVRDGCISSGDEITSVHSGNSYTVKNVGLLRPQEESTGVLYGGQVGWITCNMRSTKEAHIGDTLHHKGVSVEPLPGFVPAKCMVFAGVFPMDQSEHVLLRSAIEKLALNDPAVSVTPDTSPALGQGWRVGFLGLLHMEVFNQRLEQEYGAEAIVTAPSVTYKVKLLGKGNIKLYGAEEIYISNPTKLPDPTIIAETYEPIVLGTIITPDKYLGDVLSLCMDRRGVQVSSSNIDNERILLQFTFPLNEIIVDFHDSLKSVTSGFASFDYEDKGFVSSKLVRLNILLNGVVVDELSTIVHITKAVSYGKKMCAKLLDIIPRQQFQVAIQAAVGGKIVGRENLKAFRKDVTAKLYGGDVTRRMKLLRAQSEGKKRLKTIANIDLPRETFINVLKR